MQDINSILRLIGTMVNTIVLIATLVEKLSPELRQRAEARIPHEKDDEVQERAKRSMNSFASFVRTLITQSLSF